MKISDYGSISSTGSVKPRRQTASSGSFSGVLAAAEAEDTAASAPAQEVAATAVLSNLLSMQEISEDDFHRRKLAQQGKTMLDVLEALRKQLLTGMLPPHLIQDLSRQLSIQKQLVNDHTLNGIIEDIELRAAVELAKLERAIIR